ncbi:hypothetical protein SeLEV6574_g04943 [Synchytrium endobioticum]|uniref:Uncharacterized protein n=1 Tax=Synchytrium endobioticum TaxID=286115 RepID=A0A507CWN4_9FUNG|nr:hypothetical protein SeLEV6574_g04943 [Synchytrium endobioticum]
MAASSSHTNCCTSLETVALRPSRVSNSSWSWSLKFMIEGGVKAFVTRPIGFAGIYGSANLDELGQPLLLPFYRQLVLCKLVCEGDGDAELAVQPLEALQVVGVTLEYSRQTLVYPELVQTSQAGSIGLGAEFVYEPDPTGIENPE